MVKKMYLTRLGVAMFAGAAFVGCLGRIASTDHVRSLPFHADEDTFDAWPAASIVPPAPVRVAANVRLGNIVGYYPLPVGMYATAPAYNDAAAWAPIVIDPAPEQALAQWLDRVVESGSGPVRTLDAVVTGFEWYFHDGRKAGGRIATAISVLDEQGAVVYSGERVTAVRVPFVDALFRVHVAEWLGDTAFMAALQGGGR